MREGRVSNLSLSESTGRGVLKLFNTRGEAGELGRRRAGAMEFLKYGICSAIFFAFALLFLALVSSGSNQFSFFGDGELCAEQV